MVIAEVVTLFLYVISIAFLPEYFGETKAHFHAFLLLNMPKSQIWSSWYPLVLLGRSQSL